ncbi:TIGR03557 family F420-dependent LLM class oxidoreductase [Pseudonocardia oroxyli]|uniref:F420-dependent oxidoreductase, G6PDH family n=1 Tax=Pseudonocardia oroxyli TaxID=366584 RepID=A0A1G7WKU4_PSEOR|nr:TIGR03557 family F420-dependent LLM class oxidoreductase [Pseudonocardia oroxyli]SDG72478.1 F420-dependent oxidoreductase, G6PDH family [Pseudonocardia oroxyli]
MASIGYFLSCEQYGPRELVAQAAATAAVQLDGRFVLGVGSGEALNEHVLGDAWPSVGERLAMLEEAVDLIRLLHRGGQVSHHGEYYEVQEARIYTRPEEPVPIYVSGFGPQATELAGRIGDGYCTVLPDADLVRTFRESGGGDKPVQAGMKVCWDTDREAALDRAHRLWANDLLPGQLAQTLPRPQDFADATSLVPRDAIGDAIVCGDDTAEHLDRVQSYLAAGVDEVYVQQVGADHDGFFRAWGDHILPKLS